MNQSRRKFVKDSLVLISMIPGFAGLFYGCSSPKKELPTDPCLDLSDLSDTDIETRQQLGYIAQSPFSDRNCLNCKLFIKTDESLACGSCLVLKGPVEDSGYCTVWAPIDG